VKERLSVAVEAPELSTVQVRTLVPPTTTTAGPKDAENAGGASTTVKESVAVPLSPLLEVKAPVVIVKGTPGDVTVELVTLRLTVQVPPAKTEPPDRLMAADPAVPVTTPDPHVVARLLGSAMVMSVPRLVLKTNPVASVVEAALLIVQTTCPTPSSTSVSGSKSTKNKGGASITVRLFDDAEPLSPLLEDRLPLVTENEPAELLVT
jgi:hypothetical protein